MEFLSSTWGQGKQVVNITLTYHYLLCSYDELVSKSCLLRHPAAMDQRDHSLGVVLLAIWSPIFALFLVCTDSRGKYLDLCSPASLRLGLSAVWCCTDSVQWISQRDFSPKTAARSVRKRRYESGDSEPKRLGCGLDSGTMSWNSL